MREKIKEIKEKLKSIKNYDEKLALLGEALAREERGDLHVEAGKIMFELYLIYAEEKYLIQAVKHFEKAVKLGEEEGKYWMALCYLNKGNVKKAYKLAKELVRRDATRGNYVLGLIEMRSNREKAKELLKRAQELGEANFMLGIIYKGEGNYEEAIKYFERAAEKGIKEGEREKEKIEAFLNSPERGVIGIKLEKAGDKWIAQIVEEFEAKSGYELIDIIGINVEELMIYLPKSKRLVERIWEEIYDLLDFLEDRDKIMEALAHLYENL